MFRKKQLVLYSTILLCLGAISCQGKHAESETTSTLSTQEANAVTESQKANVTVSQDGCTKTPDGVAGLPYAHGNVFSTLDDYLAHLKTLSAIDLPYWREISPGVYEQVVRMPEAKPEMATREELMRKYCFDG